jgi:anthraniloyl-CoA monooxygenase
VSDVGRITPGCPGLYAPEHEAAWKRLADFIHAETSAKLCIQIGHAGRKASTCLPWQAGGIDAPLPAGNWPILAPSAIPYKPASQTPKAMDEADLAMVKAQFVASAEMALRAGADMIELHAAHGYLIGSFISPVTNKRTDAYGGPLENRMRYPLEVFAAMRAVWPDDRPMSVRISAHDWIDGGVTPDDAVAIAAMFKGAGADVIDVSSGQTDPAEKPVYGRMFQTPFSDRIRQDAGIATMTVGNISDWDQVNGILMAGRADLVCLARAHLADPYWTLHAAVEQGDTASEWPMPYKGGRDLAFRLRERQMEVLRA